MEKDMLGRPKVVLFKSEPEEELVKGNVDNDPELIRAEVEVLREDYPETYDVVKGIVDKKHADIWDAVIKWGEGNLNEIEQHLENFSKEDMRRDYEHSTLKQLDDLAKEKVEKSAGSLTFEQAFDIVVRQHPALYNQYLTTDKAHLLTLANWMHARDKGEQ